jgi:hypothetical protein
MPRNDEIQSYDEDSEILDGLEKAASGRLMDKPRRRPTVDTIKRSASDFVRMAEGRGIVPAISANFGGEPIMAGNVAPGTIVKTDTGEKAGVVTKDDGMGITTVKQEDGTEVEMDSKTLEDKAHGITSGYSFGDEIYIGEPSEADSWSRPFIGTVVGRKTVTGAYTLMVEAANGKVFDIPEERIGKKASISKKALEPSIQQDPQTAPQQASEKNTSENQNDDSSKMEQEEEEQEINMDNRQQAPDERPGEYGNIYEKYLQDMLMQPDISQAIIKKMLEEGKVKPEMIVRLDSYIPDDGNIDANWVKKNGMTLLNDFVALTGVNNLNKLSSIFPKAEIQEIPHHDSFDDVNKGPRDRCRNCGRPIHPEDGELCHDCVTGLEDNLEVHHEDIGELDDFSM